MKLQKASLFGLYAVLELASDPERQLSATDIADKYGISTHHLAKVMRTLVRGGLVQAVRGVGGGYRFSGNVNRTTVLEVIELFEKFEADNAFAKSRLLPGNRIMAELQMLSDEVDDLTRAVLDTITLKTVLSNASRIRFAESRG